MMKEEEKIHQTSILQKQIIKMVAQYYRQRHDMTPVHKTLIAYKVYEEDDAKFLCDLHSIAAGIISPEVVVRGVLNTDENGDLERYNETTIEEIRNAGIKVDFIKVNSNEEENLKNIRIYEGVVNGESVRVVSVPIQKSLTNAAQAMSLQAEIQKIKNEFYAKGSELQGETLNKHKDLEKKTIEQKKSSHEATMKDTQIRMFNIEALLNVVKEKTDLLSVAGLFNPKEKLEDKKKETIRLFNIPEQATQYILYNQFNKKNLQEQKKNKSISSVWAFQTIVKCEKKECFEDSFYSKQGRNVKANIYSLMNDGKNSTLSTVIEQFNKTWYDITFNTTTCIASIISRIYELLNYGEDLSGSFSSSSKEPKTNMSMSINLVATNTFEEVFKKYDIGSNKSFRTNPESQLKDFYTAERLGKIKPQKGGDIIPKSIQKIAFLHYFEKINKKFCQDYSDLEKQDNKQKLFTLVFEHLKQVYELVKAINQSFDPSLEENYGKPSVYCEDIQKYFDFLDFLFQSSKLIKQITGREFALESIKSFFEQLKSRENKLLSYILSHQDDIKEGESLNYYDLYLLIIKENSKGAEGNLEYIYKLILKLKADQIYSRYRYSQKRSVEAIRSYSEIIENFSKIPEGKKEKFKKLEIEKKIASLLLNITLPEEAAKIFMKNHLVRSAEKCFKQVLMGLSGDSKAKKYIEYGKFFETEFNFSKAIEYYEYAFEAAKSTERRKEAIKTKIDCSMRMLNPRDEMKRMFMRYYTAQCTEEEFFDTPLILESEQEIQEVPESKSVFLRLSKLLKWDESTSSSVFAEKESSDDDA